MARSLIVEGRLHAPYFIFVRAGGTYADDDLLRLFGLTGYRPTSPLPRHGPYALLADDGPWKLLADDWSYTLWHLPTTRPTIESLGRRCDVFACSVGDSDHSFDFAYHRGGRLVRRYVVEDPDHRGGRVVEDVGEPLPGEADAFEGPDELDIVLGVARSLGIRAPVADRDVRVYAPPPSGRG
ncbi:MAG TPA: hypothetical protein VF796_29815 [Humisphaera sp.]